MLLANRMNSMWPAATLGSMPANNGTAGSDASARRIMMVSLPPASIEYTTR